MNKREYQTQWMREWRLHNPEKAKLAWRKARLKILGITEQLYNSILGNQLGLCAICCEPMNPVCVDHDHKTGKIRGLLCIPCNWKVGFFETSNLEAIKTYLEIV